MHSAYFWGLLLTLIATVGVIWWDSNRSASPDVVVPVIRQLSAPLNASADVIPLDLISLDVGKSVANVLTPRNQDMGFPEWALHRPLLPIAQRDIFSQHQPISREVSPSVLPSMAPPPELAPPPNVQFLGLFVDPHGVASVYVVQADQELEAKLGDTLPSGYVVESFNREELHLVYPRLGTRVVLPLGTEP